MYVSFKRSIIFLFGLLALTACSSGGGGGSKDPAVAQGQFIDAAVEGLQYTSGTQSGVTDVNGNFSYQPGQAVTFTIGGILIGTVSGKNVITPVDLVAGAINEADPVVTNIVQFLLTIDEDQNSTNGIQISAAMRTAAASLSVDFASATFDTDASVQAVIDALAVVTASTTRTLVDEITAQGHLGDSLLALMAGIYSGTFTGDDAGTWTVTIGTDGTIMGDGVSVKLNGGPFTISGSVATSGNLAATGFAGLATWTGNIDRSAGVISGTWDITSQALSGTFIGSKK